MNYIPKIKKIGGGFNQVSPENISEMLSLML